MNAVRAILSSLVVLVLAGCASIQIRSDYDDQASFARLGTYSWGALEPDAGGHPAFSGPLLGRRLRAAVDAQLASKGYRKVTSGTPDFRIAYRVVAEQVSTVDRSYGYGSYYGRGFGGHGFGHRRYGGYGLGYGYGSSYARESTEGTVILDIIDARNDELIWRGWATGELAANPKPKQVHEYITKAVGKILDDFPPEGGEALAALAP